MLINPASRMMRKSMGKIHYEFTQAPLVEMTGVYGIYLNVPSCFTRCNYCPFYSELFAKHADRMGEYLEEVRLEIQQSRLRGKVQWTYVGGGTPNTLSPAQLGELVNEIRKQIDPDLLGIELLPARVNDAYLRELRALGFSRVSMGVQTLDEEIIRKTGRTYQTEDGLEHKIRLAQELGMWVSLDLMVGLAGQTASRFRQDVEQIIRLAPNQVAIYPIVLVKGVQYGFTPSMSTIDQFQCIESVDGLMQQNGYHRSTAWIFSKAGNEVHDTSGSELGAEYIGFGAGAYSVFGQWRVQNLPILPYLRSMQSGKRKAFVSLREGSNEDMRRISKMIYRMRLDDRSGPGWMPCFALTILALTGYCRGQELTAKGRMLAHEISRAGMEALAFAIQYPDSVDNLAEHQAFCQACE